MKKMISISRKSRLILALSLGFLLASCGASNMSMPIADEGSGVDRNGEMVWVDLLTHDAKASQDFFSELLGWTYNEYGDYSRAMSGDKPVTGIIQNNELQKGEKNSYWVISAAVTDISESTSKASYSGGKIIAATEKVPGRGRVAVIQDPQGAVFGVMSSKDGYIRASKARNGEWVWAELWTTDAKAAATFYSGVLGASVDATTEDGESYLVLSGAKHAYAGIVKSPVQEEEPIWLPVMRVNDVEAVTEKAASLGSTIFQKPITMSGGNKLALITTPNGAPFLLQEVNN